MSNPVTILAPIILAPGKTEADLLTASAIFQREFVSFQPEVLRRELIRKNDGTYLDIIQFRSEADAVIFMEREKESSACTNFFSVMDMSATDETDGIELYQSLETY